MMTLASECSPPEPLFPVLNRGSQETGTVSAFLLCSRLYSPSLQGTESLVVAVALHSHCMDALCAFVLREMLPSCEEYEDAKRSRSQGFLWGKTGNNRHQYLKYKARSLVRRGDTFQHLER